MKKRPFLLGVISSLVFVGLLLFAGFLFLKNERNQMLKEENQKEIKNLSYTIIDLKNDSLSKLILNDLNGNKISFDNDKVLFINFWATWCMPCVAEMPSIQKLIESKNEFDYVDFIFVTDQTKDKISSFEAKKKFGFKYSIYSKKTVPSFIDHTIIPTSYVIDQKNLIAYKFEGSINYNSVLFKKFLSTLKN